MARLVEWHDDHARDSECVRFRSAVRRRRLREWLRRVPCRCQRPVLLRPAEEKILVGPVDTVIASAAEGWCATIRASKNRRLASAQRETLITRIVTNHSKVRSNSCGLVKFVSKIVASLATKEVVNR